MSDGGSATEYYTYDASNRLRTVARGTGGGAPTFTYYYVAHDQPGAGQLLSRTYPDGTITTYGYDSDGHLHTATVGTNTTTYGYDAAGQLLTTALPNGWTQTNTYAAAGRLTSAASSKSGQPNLASATYTLDADGNPTQIVRDGNNEYYSYDPASRVTAACYGHTLSGCPAANLISYAYDQVGNRISQTNAGTTTTYSYDNADELSQAAITGGATTTYGYDHNGNETGSGSRTITYNIASEVTQIKDGGTTTATFSYDGLGNRLTKTAGATTTSYLWDENASLPLLAEEKNGSTVLRSYRYGLGVDALAMHAGSGDYYFHTAGLGSTAAVTNGTGSVEFGLHPPPPPPPPTTPLRQRPLHHQSRPVSPRQHDPIQRATLGPRNRTLRPPRTALRPQHRTLPLNRPDHTRPIKPLAQRLRLRLRQPTHRHRPNRRRRLHRLRNQLQRPRTMRPLPILRQRPEPNPQQRRYRPRRRPRRTRPNRHANGFGLGRRPKQRRRIRRRPSLVHTPSGLGGRE